MSSPAEIKKRLEQNWLQFLRENSALLSVDHIDGGSPPSVFVGRYGYPKVRVGPMIPPLHGDTEIMDRPEQWAGRSIEEIANYRLSLVTGVASLDVHATSGRFIENLHDLSMSGRSVEAEAAFDRHPLADIDLEREVRLNAEAAPFGPAAPLKHFKLVASSTDRRIASTYYDTDLRAADAIIRLYRKGLEISRIERVLSVGMLGEKKSRKLVPTRWSITATDDVLSKNLVKENEGNTTIDRHEVTEYFHLGNHYVVIMIPDEVWSYEMIESWVTHSGEVAFGSDCEDARGLDHYPSIAGAYFAARLAVAEHLSSRRRKAAALVLREIHPEYVMPLGVWQIREGVREAMKTTPSYFDDLASALGYACSRLSISTIEVARRSMLMRNLRNQRRITDFA